MVAPVRGCAPTMTEPSERKLLHTRQVSCRGYQLDGERWEIEGRMVDLKNFPVANADRGGRIAVGEPLHDISLSLVIDSALRILHVRATIDAAPFNQCAAITGAFRALEGLTLTQGFSRQAKALLGGVKGCTHLLELLGPIATTAYQTLWQSEEGYDVHSQEVDRLLDSCHTWSRDAGAAAKLLAEMRTSPSTPEKTEQQSETTP